MSKVYRFTGPPENWVTGIGLGLWAVNENNKALWDRLEPGDIALLHSTAKSTYSTKVTSSIVGYAIIASKKWIKNEPWWIQEKEATQNMWPYVFSLDELYLFSDKLDIDFSNDIIDKTRDRVKHEVEVLASSGITLASLNRMAQQASPTVMIPNFPVNGSASGVNSFFENLILEKIDNYYLYKGAMNLKIEDRLAEEIDEQIENVSMAKLREDALAFKPTDNGYVTKDGIYVVRKDNERQKRIVARLEDYRCQICGFKCEYIRKNGKQGWIIEIDHIIDKANGGTEELSNLWALCPNCHKKKTRKVIIIDSLTKTVTENSKRIAIQDNHLGW